VQDRKLIVNKAEAETVKLIFARYQALGCVSSLQVDLDRKAVRSKQRILTSGRMLGGSSFGRGALYHLLQNRIYRGEVVHKGTAYAGEHEAIVDEELWNAVQAKLSGNRTRRRQARIESGAILGGLIFDDRGNRMSPTYTMRRGNRYRYYISQALLHGKREGSRARVSADDVERLVVEHLCRRQKWDDMVADLATGVWSAETRELIQTMVDRVVIRDDEIEVTFKVKGAGSTAASIDDDEKSESRNPLRLPLPSPHPRERKGILVPGNSGTKPRRIDRALVLALARARSWMRALQQAEFVDTAEIAQRFALSEPHVRRLLRFVYLAPDIVEAIVEGRQPRILTVKLLLRGISLDWADQRAAFGFH
jgi:site-specific DNA recombinase